MGPTWPHHSRCSSSYFATPLRAFITTLSLLMLHCSSSYFVVPPASLLLLSCFVVHLCVLLFLSMFRYSSYYFVVPSTASLLLYVLPLFLLCCSSPCFITPPALLGCYSPCLIVAPCFASLLFIVFHCCSVCFTTTHCALLLFLFWCYFMLGCCSCFATLVVSLLHGVSPLLHTSLFSCPLGYLFALCCFVVPLPRLVLRPDWYSPCPFFFVRCWRFKFGIDWEEA